jgi:hypothetical protein
MTLRRYAGHLESREREVLAELDARFASAAYLRPSADSAASVISLAQ